MPDLLSEKRRPEEEALHELEALASERADRGGRAQARIGDFIILE